MSQEVAIIGAGVSGLTCAVLFAEQGRPTTIFAEEIGSATTSSVAAAIWFPFDAEPAEAVIAWSLETFEVLRELSALPDSGVSFLELRTFARAGEVQIPAWALSLGASLVAPDEVPPVFTSGYSLSVPLTDTSRYLEYLAERFRQAGGNIEVGRRFARLEEVSLADSLVINCAGVGAQSLVPDPQVEPHRGQVVLVASLREPYAVVCDDPPLMYAIPRGRDCVFGGTNEISTNRQADPATTAAIVEECSRALQIEPPEVLQARAGLRPYRHGGIRVSADRLADGRRVIHNYGHGGSGFTLSWGCARAVLALSESA